MQYKKANQLKDVDAAYLAGLVDGEGTITLIAHRAGNLRSPVLSIANTDFALVDWPLQVTGVGYISKRKAKKKHYKDAFSYVVQSDQALSIIEQILPYLKNKSKKIRAEMLLNDYKKLTPRNGKYTKEILTARELFVDMFLAA